MNCNEIVRKYIKDNGNEIVRKYLKDNGFAGLGYGDEDCGCLLEDLFSCGSEYTGDCRASHLHESEDYPDGVLVAGKCGPDCTWAQQLADGDETESDPAQGPRPCPVCGSDNLGQIASEATGRFRVVCLGCNKQGGCSPTPGGAEAAWNDTESEEGE